MLKNTPTTIGLVARLLHWVMSILIISIIAVGFYMTDLPNSEDKWYIFGMHKSIGVLILALVVFRIIWRLVNLWPGPSKEIPKWQEFAANADIFLLYCMMLIMPLSGFLGSLIGGYDVSFFGLFTIKAIAHNKELSGYFWDLHNFVPWLLVAAIAVHFLAAMYHHFIMKDNVLGRMWRGE